MHLFVAIATIFLYGWFEAKSVIDINNNIVGDSKHHPELTYKGWYDYLC